MFHHLCDFFKRQPTTKEKLVVRSEVYLTLIIQIWSLLYTSSSISSKRKSFLFFFDTNITQQIGYSRFKSRMFLQLEGVLPSMLLYLLVYVGVLVFFSFSKSTVKMMLSNFPLNTISFFSGFLVTFLRQPF